MAKTMLGNGTFYSSDITASLQEARGRLTDAADKCARRLLLVDEVRDFLNTIEQDIANLLPTDSVAFRIYDRSRKEIDRWWEDGPPSGYVTESHCKKIQSWLKRELKLDLS